MAKLIISDLDNTLWHGVVGQDKVRLNRKMVKMFQELSKQGILVAFVSRNNFTDTLNKLTTVKIKHQEVIVSWKSRLLQVEEVLSHFNFQDKDVIFVDDDPYNRELILHHHPDITVWEPNDLLLFTPLVELTEEDKERVLYTEAEKKRKRERRRFTSEDDFLDSLSMTLTVYKNHEAHIKRVEQLLRRTTQFNFSQLMYNGLTLGYLEAKGDILYTAKLEDSFGSMGVVGVIIIEPEALVKQFVLSCRVLGRGVESAFMKAVVSDMGWHGNILPMFEVVLTKRNKEVVPTALLNLSKETPWIKVQKKF